MFAHLGPMLGPSWADVGASWGYVGASWGYVGRSRAMLVQKHVECHRAKKHCKLQGVLSTRTPHREVRGRGPTMLAHLLAYVGLCWPILRAMWAQLGAMLTQLGAMLAYLEGYVGRSWGLCRPILRPMLAHVDPCGAKRSEKWEQQKNTVKRRIFWGSAAYLGAMLAHLGAMLAHLGGYVAPAGGYVGPSWSYVGPSWGYLGPSWGYVGPSWGLCWPILRPMLAQVDPSWATRSGNGKKMRRAQNTVKRGTFWRPGVSAAGAAAPLSYGEERNAFGKDTARGPLAGFKRWRATAGQGPNYVGPSCGYMLAYVRLMLTHVEPKDPKNGNSKKTL